MARSKIKVWMAGAIGILIGVLALALCAAYLINLMRVRRVERLFTVFRSVPLGGSWDKAKSAVPAVCGPVSLTSENGIEKLVTQCELIPTPHAYANFILVIEGAGDTTRSASFAASLSTRNGMQSIDLYRSSETNNTEIVRYGGSKNIPKLLNYFYPKQPLPDSIRLRAVCFVFPVCDHLNEYIEPIITPTHQ